MANWKRSHRLRLPSQLNYNDRSQSKSPPKRRKTPSPSPLQQMQTQMAKTNERISMMESRFEQHLRPFAPSQAPPDGGISVRASSDGELLDYTEDEASLVNEPDHSIKPSHETNLS